MQDRTAIIVSAGEGKRWDNYLNIDKSEIVISDNEKIIDRTVRQILNHGATLYIISNKEQVAGIDTNRPKNRKNYTEANKLASSMYLWNKNGRTIILFGDTYFTEGAIDKIMSHDKAGFWVFGRPFNSNITGKEYGEIYGLSFYSDDIKSLLFYIERCNSLEKRGVIEKANAWAIYRASLKLPDDLMAMHIVGSNFVNIDDWTEDFDYPIDYDRFMENWANAGMINE